MREAVVFDLVGLTCGHIFTIPLIVRFFYHSLDVHLRICLNALTRVSQFFPLP